MKNIDIIWITYFRSLYQEIRVLQRILHVAHGLLPPVCLAFCLQQRLVVPRGPAPPRTFL